MQVEQERIPTSILQSIILEGDALMATIAIEDANITKDWQILPKTKGIQPILYRSYSY